MMKIVNKNISEIHPYKNNPRRNDSAVDAVAASIHEFGFKVPCVIDPNGNIIAGHTRYKAAKKLGLKEIPCIVADDLTQEQIKAFRLVDNKVSEMSEWDLGALEIELEGINDIDMSEFGFDFEKDIERIDYENIGKSGTSEMLMIVDGTKIPITKEDRDEILDRLDNYIEKNGVSYGFVRGLLNG